WCRRDHLNSELTHKWPLGQQPTIALPIPKCMDALVIHRDCYGPPAKVIQLETVAVPELHPEDATQVLVSILACGPNFNTNFAALGLPVPVFGRGESATIHIPGSDALGIVVDAGAGSCLIASLFFSKNLPVSESRKTFAEHAAPPKSNRHCPKCQWRAADSPDRQI